MKKISIATVVFTFTLLLTSNAFAFSWYWGDGPEVSVFKMAVPSLPPLEEGKNRVWVPFTIETSGDYLAGWGSYPDPYFNGAPGSAAQNLRMDVNNVANYIGFHYVDTVAPKGFAVTSWNSYKLGLLDGVYTPGGNIGLTYYGANDLNRDNLLEAFSSNSFEVTVGDVPQNAVPEPATMLLFGSGLVGAFIKRRRKA